MLFTKIQPQSFLDSGETDFKCFCHILVWRQSCSVVQKYLYKLSLPLQQKAPYKIWRKFVKLFQRKKTFIDYTIVYMYIAQVPQGTKF